MTSDNVYSVKNLIPPQNQPVSSGRGTASIAHRDHDWQVSPTLHAAERAPIAPPIFALFITFRTGYVQVVTYPTAFDRALAMIQYADQPVVLRMQDYT